MKVASFTFIRNAVKYDYPIEEAIRSILPLCDEVFVAVGESEDETLALVLAICPEKIRIVPTVWDDSLRTGGRVLAVETDKAFASIPDGYDWAFYIQGDEVMHEQYLPVVREQMERFVNDTSVDGLLFNYAHFYGSYEYVGASTQWYRKEIRVVRKRKDIYSYKDAQGFRKGENEKLRVKEIPAFIYHYGWVKDPRAMQRKQETFNKLWHTDDEVERMVAKADEFDYSQIDALKRFDGTHPAVMQKRIEEKNWKFDFDISFNRFRAKDKLKFFVEKLTGWRIGEYKNYIKI